MDIFKFINRIPIYLLNKFNELIKISIFDIILDLRGLDFIYLNILILTNLSIWSVIYNSNIPTLKDIFKFCILIMYIIMYNLYFEILVWFLI